MILLNISEKNCPLFRADNPEQFGLCPYCLQIGIHQFYHQDGLLAHTRSKHPDRR